MLCYAVSLSLSHTVLKNDPEDLSHSSIHPCSASNGGLEKREKKRNAATHVMPFVLLFWSRSIFPTPLLVHAEDYSLSHKLAVSEGEESGKKKRKSRNRKKNTNE